MARYERMSVRTYVSLAVLNAGQALIFTLGLIAVLVMCVVEIGSGTKTVGDFVFINLMMLQLYQPLNFMGMVYRDIRQAIVDIEAMFAILVAESRNRGRSRREAVEGECRRRCGSRMSSSPMIRAVRSCAAFRSKRRRATPLRSSARPARGNRPYRGSSSASTSRLPGGY